MKTGIELIAEERRQQVEKHGRTVQSDAIYNKNGELLISAVKLTGVVMGMLFPENWDKKICANMDAKTRVEKLTIAGALIAAEIDRLNHLNQQP